MPPKQDLSGGSFPAGLQKGDLMFAKLFGFPWWPSVVRSVRHAYNEEQPLVRVRFCHTDDNATLRPKELIRFVDQPDWRDVKAHKFKSASIKKKWEAALRDAEAHTVDPEATWSDDEEARLEELHAKQAPHRPPPPALPPSRAARPPSR